MSGKPATFLIGGRRSSCGRQRSAIRVQRHLATGDQYLDHHHHLPDGVSDPEHAKPRHLGDPDQTGRTDHPARRRRQQTRHGGGPVGRGTGAPAPSIQAARRNDAGHRSSAVAAPSPKSRRPKSRRLKSQRDKSKNPVSQSPGPLDPRSPFISGRSGSKRSSGRFERYAGWCRSSRVSGTARLPDRRPGNNAGNSPVRPKSACDRAATSRPR